MFVYNGQNKSRQFILTQTSNPKAEMGEHFPIIAIELILVLGGALGFAWWQFRDLDREAAKRKLEQEQTTNSESKRPEIP